MIPALRCLRLVLPLLAAGGLRAAEWTWARDLPDPPTDGGSSRALLWIPPAAPAVRAVVVASAALAEYRVLEHPRFRAALREAGFAALWIGAWDRPERFADAGLAPRLERLLAELAAASGYFELAHVPVMAFGQADAAVWPWRFARARPDRTLAVIALNGEWPYGDEKPPAEAIEPALNGIPALVALGEYEWAAERVAFGLAQRAVHPGIPLTLLGESGGGRFDLAEDKIAYLALYVRKAAAARLPRGPAPGGAATPSLVYVDATADGWLADHWRADEPARVPAAPLAEYAEPDEAFWCFDEEHAVLTEKFRRLERGRRVALVGFRQEGQLVPQVAGTPEQVSLRFPADGADTSLVLQPTYLDRVPRGRPERWTGLPAGAPIGAPGPEAGLSLLRLAGPVEQTAPDTFSLAYDACHEAGRPAVAWLVALHSGNESYKRGLQQAAMPVPARRTEGRSQTIDFPPVSDRRVRDGSMALAATSDAGLPVRFYVAEGPAVVDGAALRFTPLPVRARLPLRVTVVAWQFGRGGAAPVQSALPVARTFFVTP